MYVLRMTRLTQEEIALVVIFLTCVERGRQGLEGFLLSVFLCKRKAYKDRLLPRGEVFYESLNPPI